MTNTPERDDGRDTRNANRPAQPAVPSITPRSAVRSPQLQVSDADVVRELVHHGR